MLSTMAQAMGLRKGLRVWKLRNPSSRVRSIRVKVKNLFPCKLCYLWARYLRGTSPR